MSGMPEPMKSRCWRCKGQGFIRQPCQQCGALRTVRYGPDGEEVSREITYMAGSVWGDSPPPMTPKPKAGADR